MKINKLTTNTNFNGYKNLIGYGYKNKYEEFAYLGFQLDNNGTKDLDKWHEILKLFEYEGEITSKDDTVIFTYAKVPQLEGGIRLNSCALADSGLLNDEYYPDKNKKSTIKAYQFVANLTKRIMNDNLFNFEYKAMAQVAQGLFEEMKEIFKDEKTAKDFLIKGTLKLKKEQETAARINRGVQKIMEKTFR